MFTRISAMIGYQLRLMQFAIVVTALCANVGCTLSKLTYMLPTSVPIYTTHKIRFLHASHVLSMQRPAFRRVYSPRIYYGPIAA
jgi:hypothetical protein